MPSEKASAILKRISSLTSEEIELMSEGQCWQLIKRYAKNQPHSDALQVCFTGFSAKEKEELATLAKQHGLEPVGSVTSTLFMLCTGENAGPAKIAKAKEKGIYIIDSNQFKSFLETGELP